MNIDEQIEYKEGQIKLLQKERRKLLDQKKREEEKRACRLLEWGQILESLLEKPEQYKNEQIEILLKGILNTTQVKEYFRRIQAEN